MAPAKAQTEIPFNPKNEKWNPLQTARAAPREAPLETPRVNGVARGLRKRAWNAIPQTAREAPARPQESPKAKARRGNVETERKEEKGE
mgnify:CR=1 FL=1